MFELVLRKQPKKYIQRLDLKNKRILQRIFEQLERNPFEVVERLHGQLEGFHKVRMGDLRIIVMIKPEIRRIEVFKIGPRGDIYK